MPRFAANLGFLFTERPFLERFAAAARAGFGAVEFAAPYSHSPQQLADELARHALECVLFNLPMGDPAQGERGIACLPDRVPEFRDGVQRAIATAVALRCLRVNCIAGKRPAGADPAELRATLATNLRFAARELGKAGLTLHLEPINEVDVPGFFVNELPQALELIREVREDNLKLQFDCYHLHMMGEELATALERHLPAIGHVQFADAPGRHEPRTGVIPYDRLFPHLDRLGYRGWVSAEYHPSRLTEETLAWLRYADGSAPG